MGGALLPPNPPDVSRAADRGHAGNDIPDYSLVLLVWSLAMYVVCVTVYVLPDRAAAFVAATLENASATRAERGCARFDLLRAVDDPTRFFLYEVYATDKDFAAHQQTPHYLRWKEAVAPMMAQPRSGVKHTSLSPDPWA